MSVAYETPHTENDRPVLRPLPSSPPPVLPPRRPHRNRRAWLAAVGLSAVVVLGIVAESVPPGTPGHQLWTTLTGGAVTAAAAPASAPAQTTAPAQADPQLAAIQQIIQQANAEQIQAIATQNPSVMSDTATAAHYQQLSQ